MRLALLLFALLSTVPALAQQPGQTPSQAALQITVVLGQWAQALEILQKQNADMHIQLDAVTKERDELKAKLEATKP